MFNTVVEFVSAQQGDSADFIAKAQAIVIGIARGYSPARLYVVRIDKWFGPKWMNFAGTFTAGKFASAGIHKTILHVPPFVPHRVVAERVFVGPDFEETVAKPPLHIECSSEYALGRRIVAIDKAAAFLWFSGESEALGRGSVMASHSLRRAVEPQSASHSPRCPRKGMRIRRFRVLSVTRPETLRWSGTFALRDWAVAASPGVAPRWYQAGLRP